MDKDKQPSGSAGDKDLSGTGVGKKAVQSDKGNDEERKLNKVYFLFIHFVLP